MRSLKFIIKVLGLSLLLYSCQNKTEDSAKIIKESTTTSSSLNDRQKEDLSQFKFSNPAQQAEFEKVYAKFETDINKRQNDINIQNESFEELEKTAREGKVLNVNH